MRDHDEYILRDIRDALNGIHKELRKMSAEMDALKAQVAATLQVEASAIALIKGIAAQLAAAAEDPAAVADLANQLNTSAAALAACVTANTPAEPKVPVPGPVPSNP